MRLYLIMILFMLFGVAEGSSIDTLYQQTIRRSLSPWKLSKKGTITLTESKLLFLAKKKPEEYNFLIDLDSILSIEKSGYLMFFYTRNFWPNMVTIELKNSETKIRLFCNRRNKLIGAVESQLKFDR